MDNEEKYLTIEKIIILHIPSVLMKINSIQGEKKKILIVLSSRMICCFTLL